VSALEEASKEDKSEAIANGVRVASTVQCQVTWKVERDLVEFPF
jgi:hypothetical protein